MNHPILIQVGTEDFIENIFGHTLVTCVKFHRNCCRLVAVIAEIEETAELLQISCQSFCIIIE